MGRTTADAARETADTVREKRDEAAELASDSAWVEGLARAGLVARGSLYVLVAAVALQLATGHQSIEPDKHGALEAVARQPLGRLLLSALTVGFAGYAVWRYVQGLLDSGESGWAKRLGNIARGLLYTSFVVTTLTLVVGAGGGGHDPHKEVDVTARVLSLPVGRFLVGALGLAVLAGGAYQAWRALSQGYWKKLAYDRMRPVVRWVVLSMATLGLAARMVVFGLIGAFLVRAAARFDATEAAGVDEALTRLSLAPHGPELLVLVAAGLAAFGVFSFVEAGYRRVRVQ